MSGFFLMHRGWRDNPIFKGEFSRGDAWLWLIENACWEPSRVRIKGKTVELQRGELSFAQRFMAEKWGWSKSRVDRFLADLRDENMIETRSKNGATENHAAGQGQCIITICNYVKYQGWQERERDNEIDDVRGNVGATAGQQRGKEEQRNKGTRVIIDANASIAQNAVSGAQPSAVVVNLFGEPDDVPAPAPPKPELFVEVWNELAKRIDLKTIRGLTPARRQTLKARINGYSLEDFHTVLGAIERSPFLRGEKAWAGATFDWVIKQANFQKILEGNYDR